MTFSTQIRTLFGPKQPDPSYPVLPEVDENRESSISGLYLTGDIGGTPLIKLGLNEGVDLANRLRAELGPPVESDPELLDVVVVGAGSSGLGAAMRAHELGMRYLVLDSDRIATTVHNMYKGKILFAEPDRVPNRSTMWFEECTREELLERWRRQVSDAGLAVHEHENVTDIQQRDGHFVVESARRAYRARRVILAVGMAGNPRKAGATGEAEHADRIKHHLADPDRYTGKRIFIYGGGDVAAEAALALCKTNEVTMVTVDAALTFPRKRNVTALLAEQAAGRLDLHLSSTLERVETASVTFRDAAGREQTVPNDVVFEMIGAELPLPFFRRIGIRLEGDWYVRRWVYLGLAFLFTYSLYGLKKFPELPYAWPFNHFFSLESFSGVVQRLFGIAFLPFSWIFDEQARQDIYGTLWFQQGYLYSLLYTVAFAALGYQAFYRWSSIARDNRYQKWRFISLTSFQVGFFLIANVVAVQALTVQYSWRAWGLSQPWPLSISTFNWFSTSDPKFIVYGFIGAGLFLTFIAIPWASRNHGKRFCTWICGCGGLAETLGDRWRHLAPKGKRSRSWEFQGAVVLVAATIATVVTVGMFKTRADNIWMQSYQYMVEFWLIAVIPIALYPFFGGKVWCRYWCPLAAWNQVLARWYGRLTIKSNEHCISCTMCSRYCQVGVDVMAFAKSGASFDNRNSGCIQCGICIDVCPMDVLSFDHSSSASPLPPVMAKLEAVKAA
ncbi:MAG: NAD(P)-binding domain-containing protein [Gemmatimonadetes bacterium]|nr:NAD(P)-binding domain-containing protein [Gemmatimonadota bacterium]